MSEITQSITSIALAIVGLAIIAVIVSNRANTSNVIKAAAGGFSQSIGAAVSPVTGGTGFSGNFGYTGGIGGF